MPFAIADKNDVTTPDDKVVLDPNTNTTIAFPATMSDDEISHHIQNDYQQSPLNPENVKQWNPDFYTREFRPALEGKNLYEPSFITSAFLKNAASMATFGAYKPDAETQAMFKQFAPTATMAGQMTGFAAPAVVLGGLNRVIGGLLTKIPAVGGLLGAVSPTMAKVAGSGLRAGATMGEYTGVSEAIDQGKEGQFDFGKIGGDVLKQTAMWGITGGVTGAIAKPLAELHGAEKIAQASKEMAVTAGTMAAITKANGGDDKDAILAGGLAAVYHGAMLGIDDINVRKAALKDVQNLNTDYVRAKNGIINKADAYGVAQAHLLNESEQVVEAYKQAPGTERQVASDKSSVTGKEGEGQTEEAEKEAIDHIAEDPHMTQQVIGAMAQRVARGNDESFTLGGFFPGGELFKAVYDKFFPNLGESKARGIEEQQAQKEKLESLEEGNIPKEGKVEANTIEAKLPQPSKEVSEVPATAPFLNKLKTPLSSAESSLDESITSHREFVKNEPLRLIDTGDDKKTAEDIRYKFTGMRNEQVVRGNQLADEIKRLVPDKTEREGMFWYSAAGGDMGKLEEVLKDPEFTPYKDQIKSAMNLSQNALDAVNMGSKYYQESGEVGNEIGTLRSLRDNYQNRIYEPEPPKKSTNMEGATGLKQTTRHAKARTFDTEFDAVKGGKKFSSTDYADNLSIHNEEMARVNASRKLADAMSDANVGLGKWVHPGNIPEGWEQVGRLQKSVPIKDQNGEAVNGEDGNQVYSHSVFVSPSDIAKGLRPIIDPDFTKRIDSLRKLGKYQAVVKTYDLAYSFFHHFTFVTQTLSSYKGWQTLVEMKNIGKILDTSEFRDIEQDAVGNGLLTSEVEKNQDVLRELNLSELNKINNLPGIKQLESFRNTSNEFLFGKMQRFLKVMEYQKNASKWLADHEDATDEEVLKAKRDIARGINAEFGGLNWEAMGIGKSEQSLLRLGLLAPDWLISSGQQAKMALTEGGEAGNIARGTIFKAILGGLAATQALNYLTTGHFTDKNPKGHYMELEAAPNTYVSLIRGGPGELVKLTSNVMESGVKGFFRYLSGKLSPLLRTVITASSGVNYSGRDVWEGANQLHKDINGLVNIVSNMAPIPFSVSSLIQYAKNEEKTPLGYFLVATGLGRYSVQSESSKEKESSQELQKASDKGDEDTINKMLNEGKITDDQVEKAQKISEMSPAERETKGMRVDKLIDYLSSAKSEVREELQDKLDDKFESAMDRASPERQKYLQKKYDAYRKKFNLSIS